MENYNVLSHPITLIFITTLVAMFTGIIKAIWDISKTQTKTNAILDHVVKRQDDGDAKLDGIKDDLQELIGEHRAMIRTGNLIAQHHQKKTG